MTLWVEDGTTEGFLANCANCPYALDMRFEGLDTAADILESDLVCTWDPPAPVEWAQGRLNTGTNGVSWIPPAVADDYHCHNHPVVSFNQPRGPFAVRRPPRAETT